MNYSVRLAHDRLKLRLSGYSLEFIRRLQLEKRLDQEELRLLYDTFDRPKGEVVKPEDLSALLRPIASDTLFSGRLVLAGVNWEFVRTQRELRAVVAEPDCKVSIAAIHEELVTAFGPGRTYNQIIERPDLGSVKSGSDGELSFVQSEKQGEIATAWGLAEGRIQVRFDYLS